MSEIFQICALIKQESLLQENEIVSMMKLSSAFARIVVSLLIYTILSLPWLL